MAALRNHLTAAQLDAHLKLVYDSFEKSAMPDLECCHKCVCSLSECLMCCRVVPLNAAQKRLLVPSELLGVVSAVLKDVREALSKCKHCNAALCPFCRQNS